jgi:tetratricopeptide (TPR) repeat protein
MGLILKGILEQLKGLLADAVIINTPSRGAGQKGAVAVRKRNTRKSRSNLVLDIRKLYLGGFSADLFKPIDQPGTSETEFEIHFCEDILRHHASHFEALVLLGDAYTRKGDFQKGLELDLQLSNIKPDNHLVRYNLACSYALTGQTEKALLCLDKAVELGYRDIEHLRQDHDLDVLKTDPRFQLLLKKLSTEQPEASSHQG